MEIRITRDTSNMALVGLYRLEGKWMIMLPQMIIDFPPAGEKSEVPQDVCASNS